MQEQEKRCPLHDTYRFKSQCRVTTCKFFSPFTPNRCLGMDMTFAGEDKPVSDVELLQFKFGDREMTVRDVARVRKKAVETVKGYVALYRLIQIVTDKCDESEGLYYEVGRSAIVDRMLTRKPLSLPRIGFKPWMLKFIVDEDFLREHAGPKFRLKDALRLKSKEHAEFTKAVKILCSGNTLFNNVI